MCTIAHCLFFPLIVFLSFSVDYHNGQHPTTHWKYVFYYYMFSCFTRSFSSLQLSFARTSQRMTCSVMFLSNKCNVTTNTCRRCWYSLLFIGWCIGHSLCVPGFNEHTTTSIGISREHPRYFIPSSTRLFLFVCRFPDDRMCTTSGRGRWPDWRGSPIKETASSHQFESKTTHEWCANVVRTVDMLFWFSVRSRSGIIFPGGDDYHTPSRTIPVTGRCFWAYGNNSGGVHQENAGNRVVARQNGNNWRGE